MEPIETVNYRGYKIKVYADDCAENPQTAWDNAGTYALMLNRDWCKAEPASINTETSSGVMGALADSLNGTDDTAIEKFKARIVRQGGAVVEWRGHNDIDGFAYCKADEIRKEWAGNVGQAEAYLKAHIATLAAYCNGEVYGYTVKRGGYEDSCWGFYDMEDMVREAKANIDHRQAELRKARQFHNLSFAV